MKHQGIFCDEGTRMQYHEAANIFPMDEDGLQDLADDIAKHGLLIPIEVFEGKIIDGRRRSAACVIAGVEPDYSEVNPVDPVAYVLSLNLHRRHLTEGQRAMIADKVKEYHATRAKERQKEGGKVGGQIAGKHRPKEENSGLGPTGPKPERGPRASDQIGEVLGVGGRTVRRAGRVRKDGSPEVIQAVESGKLSLNKAEKIVVNHPKEKQADAMKEVLEQKAAPKEKDSEEPESQNIKRQGIGVIRANEAINCLIRIPKDDPLRKRGFQIVTDWIKANK